jgi:hypothetical protein
MLAELGLFVGGRIGLWWLSSSGDLLFLIENGALIYFLYRHRDGRFWRRRQRG